MTFIKGMASIGAVLIGLSAAPAQAGYVVDLTQVGSDVVATGSGAIDLTGLTFFNSAVGPAELAPALGVIVTGPPSANEDTYIAGALSGPLNFGSGGLTSADSGSGDFVGIAVDIPALFVPHGYTSGASLTDTSTYAGKSFSSLGATPGTYEWTWGSGANQNFTLVVGSAIPESSTWAMMLAGFAGLGLMGYRSAGWRRATASHA